MGTYIDGMDQEAITKRIARLMDAKRDTDPKAYSYGAIGHRLGVSRETARQWHDGISIPRLDKLDGLAAELSTSAIYLLFGVAEEAPPNMVQAYLTQAECDLIRSLRSCSPDMQTQVSAYIAFLLAQSPPSNVSAIPHRRAADRK